MQNYEYQIRTKHSENIKQLKNLNECKNEYEQLIRNLQNFREKLSVDIMVPIPSSKNPIAFMNGTVIHTNELLINLGAKYFAKMTAHNAVEYCERKCEDINKKKEEFLQEQKLLMERIAFMNSQSFGETEIVETYNEDEEKQWRKRHAESVKNMKVNEAKERQKQNEQSVDYYFSRLEELEQEELEADEL